MFRRRLLRRDLHLDRHGGLSECRILGRRRLQGDCQERYYYTVSIRRELSSSVANRGGSVFGIYDAQSVIALGIISGRSTLLSGCSVIYTDVWDAYVGLPGSIATG